MLSLFCTSVYRIKMPHCLQFYLDFLYWVKLTVPILLPPALALPSRLLPCRSWVHSIFLVCSKWFYGQWPNDIEIIKKNYHRHLPKQAILLNFFFQRHSVSTEVTFWHQKISNTLHKHWFSSSLYSVLTLIQLTCIKWKKKLMCSQYFNSK